MRQSGQLLKLNIKSALKQLPLLLLGVAIVIVVFGLTIFFGMAVDDNKDVVKKLNVGVVAGSNNLINTVGKELVGGMEISETFAEFHWLDSEEEALDNFANDEYAALIVFPDQYIDGISRGENVPATLYLNNRTLTYEAAMIAELASAAGILLGSTEASSYSAWDYQDKIELKGMKTQTGNDLDATCARIILSREDAFEKITLEGVGKATTEQVYFCAAILLVLLLSGMSMGMLFRNLEGVLPDKLAANGISYTRQLFYRFLSTALLLFIIFSALIGIIAAAFFISPELFKLIGIKSIYQILMLYVICIPAVFFSAALAMFSMTVSGNEIGGVMLLFIIVAVCAYASGLILPSYYLSKSIRKIGAFMPTSFLREAAENALLGKTDIKSVIIILVLTLLIFIITDLVLMVRRNKVARGGAGRVAGGES